VFRGPNSFVQLRGVPRAGRHSQPEDLVGAPERVQEARR
jgi:hypothetical protein